MKITIPFNKYQFFLSYFFYNTTTKEEKEIDEIEEHLHRCTKEEYEQYKNLRKNKQIRVFIEIFHEIYPQLNPVHYKGAVLLKNRVKFAYFMDSVSGLNHFFLNSFFQIYLKDLMTYFKNPHFHLSIIKRIPTREDFSWCDLSPDFLDEMKDVYKKINFFIGEEEGKKVIFQISKDKTSVTRIENREKEKEILKTLEEKRNKLFSSKILLKQNIFDLIESDSREIESMI